MNYSSESLLSQKHCFTAVAIFDIQYTSLKTLLFKATNLIV
jgi:hypothetical protein